MTIEEIIDVLKECNPKAKGVFMTENYGHEYKIDNILIDTDDSTVTFITADFIEED